MGFEFDRTPTKLSLAVVHVCCCTIPYARAQNSKMFAFPDVLTFCRCRLSSKRDMTAGSPDTAEKKKLSSDFTIQSHIPLKWTRSGFCRVLCLTKDTQLVIWHAWKIAFTGSRLRLPRVRDLLWYFSRFNFPKQKDERVRLFFPGSLSC